MPVMSSLVLAMEWARLPTSRKVVALTFDADSSDGGFDAIAGALAEANAPATFFLTGRWVEKHRIQARTLAVRHAVGNHTYGHSSLPDVTDAEVMAEIDRGARVIRRITGQDPRPLFRFPFGARDDRTMEIVNRRDYDAIYWTVDTLGWKGSEAGHTAESVTSRVVEALNPGQIVLMHVGAAPDGSTLDADALPRIIAGVRARSYEFVSLRDFANGVDS